MAKGRLGLLYSRRRETHPSRQGLQSVGERLASVFQCALAACQRLEAEPALAGRCRFRGEEMLLRCNDRLQAPNTAATYHDLKYALDPFLATLYPGQRVTLEHVREGSSRLTVVIKAAENPDVETLLQRLAPRVQPVNGTVASP